VIFIPGRYLVELCFLTYPFSLGVPPNTRSYCPAAFPTLFSVQFPISSLRVFYPGSCVSYTRWLELAAFPVIPLPVLACSVLVTRPGSRGIVVLSISYLCFWWFFLVSHVVVGPHFSLACFVPRLFLHLFPDITSGAVPEHAYFLRAPSPDD